MGRHTHRPNLRNGYSKLPAQITNIFSLCYGVGVGVTIIICVGSGAVGAGRRINVTSTMSTAPKLKTSAICDRCNHTSLSFAVFSYVSLICCHAFTLVSSVLAPIRGFGTKTIVAQNKLMRHIVMGS